MTSELRILSLSQIGVVNSETFTGGGKNLGAYVAQFRLDPVRGTAWLCVYAETNTSWSVFGSFTPLLTLFRQIPRRQSLLSAVLNQSLSVLTLTVISPFLFLFKSPDLLGVLVQSDSDLNGGGISLRIGFEDNGNSYLLLWRYFSSSQPWQTTAMVNFDEREKEKSCQKSSE